MTRVQNLCYAFRVGKLVPRTLAGLAFGILAASGPIHAADQKTVLLVFAESRSMPVIAILDRAIRSRMQSHSADQVLFPTEFLDLSWFSGAPAEDLIARLLSEKYAGRRIDVVMPCGEAAIRFVLRERATLFTGVPVVFCTADRETLRDLDMPKDVTGVTMFMDWAGIVDLAVRLRPETRQIAFIGGGGPTSREWERQARLALSKYAGKLEVRYLTDLTMPDLLSAVRALPESTVGIFNAFNRDAAGRVFTTPEALALVSGAARFPIYSVAETLLGYGIVGGPMVDFEAQGIRAADLASRVLNGEHPGPADIYNENRNRFVFDARQLKRFGIDERRLPPGSIVRFGQSNLWEIYRWQIIGAIALFALQTFLIVALLLQRRQRKRAERQVDERLRFETLVSELATAFINIRAEEVDRQIQDALRRIVEELGVDRASLGEFTADGSMIRVTHTWVRPDVTSISAFVETLGLPWITGRIRAGQVVALARPEELPEEASVDRSTIRTLGVRSLALMPFVVDHAVAGVLAFSLLRDERSWPDELVQRLSLVADLFAIVLMRRRAQTALEESERRFRLMADAAPVMIWRAGSDGLCVDFNRAWLAFTGRSLEQERGDGWVEGVHPDDRELCKHDYREAVAMRRPFKIEYRLRRADGFYRSVLDNGVPLFGGDGATFTGYIGSAIDITDIKAAQQAMIESIALRSSILGSLYGEVVALNREGVILAVNEAWSQFGTQSGADPAKTSVGADYLAVCRRAAAGGEPAAAKALDAIEAVLAGRSEQSVLEYPCRSPEGTRWFAMTAEPFKRPEGGVVISHIDITRRKWAEEEAERRREELTHALRVSTLGELGATLAHEINQPLTAILSNAHAMQRMVESGRVDRREFVEALQDISQDARRTSDVVRRLRALFRKEQPDRHPLDVNDVITEVTALLGKDLERRHIALHLDLATGLPLVPGDTVQLQQVLLNLLLNACDAMNADDHGPHELFIATACDGRGHVTIEVRDSGAGVEDSELEHIFDRFVTTKPNGLGMGLSISRSIIEAHGGRIWATRNEDRGLTIHSELPSATIPEQTLLSTTLASA